MRFIKLIIVKRPSSSISDVPQNLKLIQKCGMKGTTEAMNFDYHRKSMDSWVETKHLVFCSGYKAPTVFPYLQKMSLTLQDVRPSPKMMPLLWFLVCLFNLVGKSIC